MVLVNQVRGPATTLMEKSCGRSSIEFIVDDVEHNSDFIDKYQITILIRVGQEWCEGSVSPIVIKPDSRRLSAATVVYAPLMAGL